MGLYGAWLVKAGRLGRVHVRVSVDGGLWDEWQKGNLKLLKKVCGSFAQHWPERGANSVDSHCLVGESIPGIKTSHPSGAFSVIDHLSTIEGIYGKLGGRNTISTAEFVKTWEDILPPPQVTVSSPDLAGEVVREGLVMHCGDVVYLEGPKLAQLVENSLPFSQSVIENKLNALQAELAPLEVANEQMVKKAHADANLILLTGLGALVIKFLVLFDLTYFVYSWNETEPVTYFLRSALLIAGYMYMMRTKQILGHTNLYSWLGNKQLMKLRRNSGFNSKRYFHLKEEVQKWERYSKGSHSLKCLADKSLATLYSGTIFLPGASDCKSDRSATHGTFEDKRMK